MLRPRRTATGASPVGGGGLGRLRGARSGSGRRAGSPADAPHAADQPSAIPGSTPRSTLGSDGRLPVRSVRSVRPAPDLAGPAPRRQTVPTRQPPSGRPRQGRPACGAGGGVGVRGQRPVAQSGGRGSRRHRARRDVVGAHQDLDDAHGREALRARGAEAVVARRSAGAVRTGATNMAPRTSRTRSGPAGTGGAGRRRSRSRGRPRVGAPRRRRRHGDHHDEPTPLSTND